MLFSLKTVMLQFDALKYPPVVSARPGHLRGGYQLILWEQGSGMQPASKAAKENC